MENKTTLTASQREVYDYLKLYVLTHAVAPTVREICMGYVAGERVIHKRRWPSGVHRILTALEERGWIERPPRKQRAIKFL